MMKNEFDWIIDSKDKLIALARDAGRTIMEVYHQSSAKAAIKPDGSPVTEADQRSETIILEGLAALTPSIPIVSEENRASHATCPENQFWLVDPLDGTKEFQKRDGLGSFTVNIALIRDKVPVFGLVYAPALDRLFVGVHNYGAWEVSSKQEHRLHPRPCGTKPNTAVASLSHLDSETEAWLQKRKISNIKRLGSSLKFCLIAAREVDVYPRFAPTMEWDTAAGDAVLRAVGGLTVTPDNQPLLYGKVGFLNSSFIALGSTDWMQT